MKNIRHSLLSLILMFCLSGCAQPPLTFDGYFGHVKSSKHFLIHYPKGQEAYIGTILNYAEKAFKELKLLFPRSKMCKIDIFVYNSTKDFNKLNNKKNPGWVKGNYGFDGKSISLMDIKDSVQERSLNKLIKHELGHLYIMEAAGNSALALPSWLNEGLAQYLADQEHEKPIIMAKAVRENTLMPLRDLRESFDNFKNDKEVNLAYYESLSAVEYFVKIYGFNKIRELLYLRKKGISLENAFPQLVGIEYSRFEQNWTNYLKVYYN